MVVQQPSFKQDRSTRFILPDDAPLLSNLAALWTVDPAFAAAIESASPLPTAQIQPSRSGPPTLSITTSDGRTLQLHSRHDPLDEASHFVDAVAIDQRAAFCVHGFGLGYHVKELFDRAGTDAIICVFEPNLEVLRSAFEALDFEEMMLSGRVLFFWREDKADLFGRLTSHAAAISMGFDPILHQPSVQLAPEFHRQIQSWIVEFASYCRTTISTLVINGKRTAENIARNIPWYVSTPSLSRLKDCFAGKPAIIVSAGPSLRKNKHLLKDADGKAVIIAVQTTLQPLLEIGVRPQFVTSLDYHDICTRFFEKLPRDLNTELVAEPKASSAIFDLHPGPISILGNDFADGLIRELKPQKGRLSSGATVAHLAFYLAEHVGCDPIIFVGQDLGFSDGLCYAPGTSYEDVWRPELSRFCTLEMKQWEQIVRDRNILRRATDYQGRPTYTEERLFTYLQHFERDFARTRAKVIDATEGGVLKRGAAPMRLIDALNTFCTEPFDTTAPQHPGLCRQQLGKSIAPLRTRHQEAKEIESISRDTLPLLEDVRDHIEDQVRVNSAISMIDRMRARMHEYAQTYSLVMALSQQSELNKFRADRRISAAKLDATERQRQQVQRDIDNVRSVIEASVEFQKLMQETIAIVEAQLPQQLQEAA